MGKRQAENRALRAKEAVKSKVARKAKRADIFKRAEKFAKEYQDQERDEIRLRREARKEQLLCSRRSQARLRHAHPWYQPGVSQGEEGSPAVQAEASSASSAWRTSS